MTPGPSVQRVEKPAHCPGVGDTTLLPFPLITWREASATCIVLGRTVHCGTSVCCGGTAQGKSRGHQTPRSAGSSPSLSTNPRRRCPHWCLEWSEELISASAAVVPSTSPQELSSSHGRESPPGLLGTLCLGFPLLLGRPPSLLLALGTRSPSLTLHPKSPCVLRGLKPIFMRRKASATQSHHTCKT